MQDRIVRTIEIEAPVERVWRALTDHKAFGEWFRVALDAPFRVGSAARGRVLHPGYEHIVFEVNVCVMEPPRRFAFEGHPGGHVPGVDYADAPMTRTEFQLEPTESGGTRLTVVESGFMSLPAQTREATYRGNEGGWEHQMRNIRDYTQS